MPLFLAASISVETWGLSIALGMRGSAVIAEMAPTDRKYARLLGQHRFSAVRDCLKQCVASRDRALLETLQRETRTQRTHD